MEERVVLGLDLSTQGLKAVAIGVDSGKVLLSLALNFDADLPEYGTTDGVHRGDEHEVTSPALMFVHALEEVLGMIKRTNPSILERAVAVSTSGQQHGAVYLSHTFASALSAAAENSLGDSPLHEALRHASALALEDAHVWLDASTSEECRAIEERIGGAQTLANLAGSRAYERYTGPQIARRLKYRSVEMEECDHIVLISAFISSLLIGKPAPVDVADGSGMLLMPINADPPQWSPLLADAVLYAGGQGSAASIEEPERLQAVNAFIRKLGAPPVPSYTVLGNIAPMWTTRFGISRDCRVVAASGDNPNSVAGLLLRPGELAVSLGTSDTAFCLLPDDAGCEPRVSAHVYRSPLTRCGYLPLVCYSNGSLARERVKGPEHSWADFEAAVGRTTPALNGFFAVFCFVPEIAPRVPAHSEREPLVIDANTREVSSLTALVKAQRPDAGDVDGSWELMCRAVVEYRAIAVRLHTEQLGLAKPSRIVLTGGGARSKSIAQVFADVFQASVFCAETSSASGDEHNSAAIGAALRAKHGIRNMDIIGATEPGSSHSISFYDSVEPYRAAPLVCAATPQTQLKDAYQQLIDAYAAIEHELAKWLLRE
eukprot:CAMPEP_0185841786 /NCGR_PEP_ID=MMETSP1353-20130828/18075_1 /TAXON_ID=1077150 /ORGANISM="Erythrolobus australicus, Strain CCMP3124" /LENGTH=600 /DNA_ID=CAMNT_0028541275 /DNA_START=22 /DNA_END=1824 /DNA_ORIENTATION=+